jgi:P-type Cu+ transporter
MQEAHTTSTCAHCGDPSGHDSVVFDERTFCCTGCRSVYEILKDHDLCDYYTVDPHAGISQRDADVSDDLSVLDEPFVLRRFTEWSRGDRVRIRFEIPMMHCASCIWLLDRLHTFDAGIHHSDVDFMRKLIHVEYDASMTTASSIARLLVRLGYRPQLAVEGTELETSERQRKNVRDLYLRLGVAAFAAGNLMMISAAQYLAEAGAIESTLKMVFDTLSIGLSIPVLLFSASPWFRSAWGALRHRRLNLDVPVALGISVLFLRSIFDIVSGTGEGFLDSFSGLVVFLLVGKIFQQKAFDAVSFDRTHRSFFPLSVRVERGDGDSVIPIERVKEGDVLLVRNGEVVPCDAILLSNAAYIDYSFVNGESIPEECLNGSLIHAGGKVAGTAARLAAVKDVSQSYLASLWERSGKRTPRRSYLNLSDRFGTVFTIGAVAIALVGFLAWLPDWHAGLLVLTSVLIIACPCALTMAAPITLGSAIGRLSRFGIYVKNSETLLELSKVYGVVFDKTGTLSSTRPDVDIQLHRDAGQTAATSVDITFIAALASHSTHPISRAVAHVAGSRIRDRHAGPEEIEVRNVEETVGQGICGVVNGYFIAIGSAPYIEEVTTKPVDEASDVAAYIAVNGRQVGHIVTRPRMRHGVADMVAELRGAMSVRLLSGDTERDREDFLQVFEEGEMTFDLRPNDKVRQVEHLREEHGRMLMVGDGLNDAGAMAAADVSIGVADGTSTLVPACDVVIPGNMIHRIPTVLRYARTMTKVIQTSLIFTVFYNALGLTLALIGVLSPVLTAIMMPVSSLIVIGISVAGARWYARRPAWE